MTISTLGQELKIICGVPRAPGDTLSAEDALQVLDLLAGTKGFSVEPGGWIPQLPQTKASGLWADSAITDGRTLISAPVGNVTETITLTSNAATLQGRYFWEKELSRFSQLCADFWQTFGQIQPVYLKWFAPDAPGPQYALLYKIEIARRSDPFSGDSVQEFTISVEREPYWRGIAPGANPKLWTFEFRHEKYTLTDLDLSETSTRNLNDTDVQNRREWNTTTTAAISQNWLEIAATDVPGDAPALVCLTSGLAASYDTEGLTIDRIYLARSTKPTSLPTQGTPASLPQVYMLNAGDGFMQTDATIVADANAPKSNKSAAGQRVTVSFASPAMQSRMYWRGTEAGSDETLLDLNLLRGQYAIFMRARASAAGSTITAYIAVAGGASLSQASIFNLPRVAIQPGVGATPSWYLHYMGIINIPFWATAQSGNNGRGLGVMNPGVTNSLGIVINAERTGGAASLYISDVILMPLDECFSYVDGIGSVSNHPVIDNTGYFNHGKTEEMTAAYNSNELELVTQLVGSPLTLLPNKINRLYYLAMSAAKGSPIAANRKLHVNIVPRWSGIRDV